MYQLAQDVFRKAPLRLNCAQAVAHAWQVRHGGEPRLVAEFADCGGGRAPGGLCGALHAACLLVPQKAEPLQRRFAERLGSTLCQELKRIHRQSCEACVAEAAGLVDEELP